MHSRGQEDFMNAYAPVMGKTSAEIDMGAPGLWPKETRDRVAMTCLMLGVPLALAFETFFVVPEYLAAFSPAWWSHGALAALVVINLVGNIYQVMVTDASGRSAELPHVLRPGWRYCFRCQLNSPPRSYHCPLCEVCVLRRDHHCAFVGACVGHRNQRYYLMGVAWALAGSSYGLWWHWELVWAGLGGLGPAAVASCVVPHLFFIVGKLSAWQFVLAAAQMGFAVAWLLSAYLLAVQAYTIARGQTQTEHREGIRAYDLGPWRNLQEVLGSRWIAAVLCPFFPSPLGGDGLNFPTKLIQEDPKDL